ncbi:MAG: hypothetical protein JO270_12460 [Acidobacteriaceae bacterium]|nr:hypothetical protein [Acidobacteriaceae bacterium]MBV8572122.1 hypothetical protein [Acidobacteriaceae bacterium]
MSLANSLVSSAAAVQFANGTEILHFFERLTKQHFLDWFHSTCARRQFWANKEMNTSEPVKERFARIWDWIPLMFDEPSINLLQFSALMSILINEVGDDLLPVTELCGRDEYPGLAYAFSAIPGVKRSYNAGEENRPAGKLFFDDPDFWSAHGSLAGADLVRAIPNLQETWNGAVYPQNLFPTSLEPDRSGFIQQADFYKFRGRGFIQITWRSNYRDIVGFVQNYSGADPTLLRYKAAWATKDPDTVCTTSTNEDWDELFGSTNLIVACRAIGLHNRAGGNYLELSADANVLTAASPQQGSLCRMGLRISGSKPYALLFRERVVQLLTTLGYERGV